MSKIKLELEQAFFNELPPAKIKRLPYAEYLFNHKKNGHKQTIYDLLYIKKDIPSAKRIIIDNILSDCTHIYKSLLPLYNFGIHFSMALAGGAVRDLLLDKHTEIKDLDIIISFAPVKLPYNTTVNILKIPSHQDLHDNLGFNAFDFPWFARSRKIHHSPESEKIKIVSSNMNNSSRIYEIVKFLIQKNHTYEDCFSPSPHDNLKNDLLQDSEYIARNLQGVLKINTNDLNYPIDILLTDRTPSDFACAFDFNICKAIIALVDGGQTFQRKFNFPQSAEDFLNSYIPFYDFLEDVKNKKITMALDNRSIKDVEISISKHLPRIEAKYGDYKINYPINDKENATFIEEKLTVIRHYELQKSLTNINDINEKNIVIKKKTKI